MGTECTCHGVWGHLGGPCCGQAVRPICRWAVSLPALAPVTPCSIDTGLGTVCPSGAAFIHVCRKGMSGTDTDTADGPPQSRVPHWPRCNRASRASPGPAQGPGGQGHLTCVAGVAPPSCRAVAAARPDTAPSVPTWWLAYCCKGEAVTTQQQVKGICCSGCWAP